MSQYFPKPFRRFGGNINVKVDLSNYARKTGLKNVTHVDTSNFVLKKNLANLKTQVDKLDIDKLAPVLVDLSELSNVVKNEVIKKTVYDELVAKVNNIDTSGKNRVRKKFLILVNLSKNQIIMLKLVN